MFSPHLYSPQRLQTSPAGRKAAGATGGDLMRPQGWDSPSVGHNPPILSGSVLPYGQTPEPSTPHQTLQCHGPSGRDRAVMAGGADRQTDGQHQTRRCLHQPGERSRHRVQPSREMWGSSSTSPLQTTARSPVLPAPPGVSGDDQQVMNRGPFSLGARAGPHTCCRVCSFALQVPDFSHLCTHIFTPPLYRKRVF